MEQAFRYRFYPTPEQETLLRRTLGCVRLVYNRALAARTEGWYERQEKIDYIQTSSLLTGWKKLEELDFLNEVSCVPLQQGLRHLQKAFTNFFAGRTKYPNFKKKRNGGSAEFTLLLSDGKTGSCGWQSVPRHCRFVGAVHFQMGVLPLPSQSGLMLGGVGMSRCWWTTPTSNPCP